MIKQTRADVYQYFRAFAVNYYDIVNLPLLWGRGGGGEVSAAP